MITLKTFVVQLTIQNPIEFIENGDIFEELKKQYERKCYKESYILDIKRIVNQSSYIVSKEDLNMSADVNVIFEANVRIYSEGDIIEDAKLIESTNILYKFENDTSIMGLIKDDMSDDESKLLADLKIEMDEETVVPVIVSRVRYHPMKNKITMKVVPFTPQNMAKELTYRVSGKYIENVEHIVNLQNEISNTEDEIKNNKSESMKFMKKIFAYNTQEKKDDVPVIDIKNHVSDKKDAIVQLRQDRNILSSNVNITDLKNPTTTYNIDIITFISSILSINLSYLKSLTTLSRIYSNSYKDHAYFKQLKAFLKI